MDNIVLETNGLTKAYGAIKALDDLNLRVERGEVFGYLGPNGSGKTTTIRLLLGLIRPTGGSATLFGLDAQRDKVEAHKRVAYVPGEAALWPNLTGRETLNLLSNIHGRVDAAYRKELVRRFELNENKKVRTYSKGNKQKINLIAALASRAELLILDEPTSGLDPLMEQVFRECVAEAKRNGQTIFLSSHILGEVEVLCDRVGILRAGKLVEVGTLEDMRHLSTVTVTATFKDKPPKIDELKGVTNVHLSGHELTCHVQGPIDELLSELAKHKPQTLLSHEPSLEELFLALYGEQETDLNDR
jgi:ABC-2 type transport system ATP-binding protein